MNDTEIYLKKYTDRRFDILDSTHLKNGSFRFDIEDVYPELLYVSFDNKNIVIPFIAEPGVVNIELDFSEKPVVRIQGTPSNDFMNDYRKQENYYEGTLDSLEKLGEIYRIHNDTLAYIRVDKEISRTSDERQNTLRTALVENSRLPAVAYILSEQDTYGFTYRQMDSLLAILHPNIPDNSFTDKLRTRRNILSNISYGMEAPDYTLFTPEGTRVNLSLYKGNYVILDFWSPDFEESDKHYRIYKNLYWKYQDKGVEIISIYVGRDLDIWRNAIIDNNYSWTHLSQLRGWESDILRGYGVVGLPHNLIIDPEGRIIESMIFGNDLENLFEKLFSINTSERFD